jgi:phosphohistidine phosphatase SixA
MRLLLTLLAVCAFAATAAAQPHVFVVRHAEKASARPTDKNNPPLSEKGRSRAAALARMLRDVRLTAIFTTELRRTQQTAEAVARGAGVELTIVPAKDTKQLIEQVRAATGNVLVIGHSNTVPEILAGLGVQQPITIADHEYDNFFIWTPATQQLLRLRYR